jgi:hypothetical protein
MQYAIAEQRQSAWIQPPDQPMACDHDLTVLSWDLAEDFEQFSYLHLD